MSEPVPTPEREPDEGSETPPRPAGGARVRRAPGRPGPARHAPARHAWFASDFHLHRDDPEGVERARAFVDHAVDEGVDALFLLGDVFRAWLGPPSLRDPGLAPFLDALRSATGRGVRVALLHGNHDFLMGPELEQACGVEVHAESLDVVLHGRRVRLLHGDAFCTLDTSYHKLHRVLRSPPLRWLFARLPASVLDGVAERLMKEAGRATGHKPMKVMDIVDEEVLATLASGVDTVVCGHVHRWRDGELSAPGGDGQDVRGRLLVMADFERSGCHARFAGGRLELVRRDRRFGSQLPVVAVDGPAGTGKSSVCRTLARRLGWLLLDSGALYRAVTAEALDRGMAADDPGLGALARELDLAVAPDGSVTRGGEPVPDARLRSPEVSAHVSQVSADPAVRAALHQAQRDAALLGDGLVAEGRDMATVVFPDAQLAVYLDARPEVRAARRMAQNPSEGRTLEEVAAALAARDARDAGRAVAPLAMARGAVRLDTSDLDQAQVVERLLELVADGAALAGPPAS